MRLFGSNALLAVAVLLAAAVWSVPRTALAILDCNDCSQTEGNCPCTVSGGVIICTTTPGVYVDEVTGVTRTDGTYAVIWGTMDGTAFCCQYDSAGMDSSAHPLELYTFAGDDVIWLNKNTQCGYAPELHWYNNTVIDAGPGDDSIGGGMAIDEIDVGPGSDAAWGYWGDDILMAPANDTGNNTLWGNEDDDTIYGGAAADDCFGGDGEDTVKGGGSADRVCGDSPQFYADNGRDDYFPDIVQGSDGSNDTCASYGDEADYTGCEYFEDHCDWW